MGVRAASLLAAPSFGCSEQSPEAAARCAHGIQADSKRHSRAVGVGRDIQGCDLHSKNAKL